MSNYVFNLVQTVKRPRNRFDLSYSTTFTGNVGDLIPCYIQEVFAGDTFPVDARCVVRNNSPFLKPIMDNLYQDIYFFYVPYRLLQKNYPKIFGQSDTKWTQTKEYKVAQLNWNGNSGKQAYEKSIADYLGLPTGVELPRGLSVLPFRAYAKIYNDWFRNENLIDETLISDGDNESGNGNREYLNNDDFSPNNYTGKLAKVGKLHDYFTSALPSPQKNANPVTISIAGDAPLDTTENISLFSGYEYNNPAKIGIPLYFNYNGLDLRDMQSKSQLLATTINPTSQGGINTVNGNNALALPYTFGSVGTDSDATYDSHNNISGTNLVAKTSDLSVISIDDLNFAIKMQSYYQALARAGSRYTEYLEYMFGVISSDSRLQRSEFLGGGRTPLNVQQVANTTQQGLAELGAFSWTNTRKGFTKSFTEHGIVLGLTCLRYKHTYQQGIERFWGRRTKFEIYNPLIAHIGEQPIYKNELFASRGDFNGEVFGFQEAFADMRYRPNKVAGEMRSNATNSLDIYTFADDYENAPVLGEEFNNETPLFVDRTVAVPSISQDQFIFNFYFEQHPVRVLPMYGTPSLSTGIGIGG